MRLANAYQAEALTLWEAIVADIKAEYLSEAQRYPWIIGFSGGKDSTLVAQAVLEAILCITPSDRTREVHVVSNDTLVESPLVIAHMVKAQQQIEDAAKNMGLPITVVTTKPEKDKTFWSLLIGKGYPSPNQNMRWCTDRLKIQPTSTYILNNISKHGAAIVVLGVRKDESNSRRNSIDKFQNMENSNLTPHVELPGAYIYRPIVDLALDDVWEILGQYPPPWGGTHRDLIQLYRDAGGGECPVVLSKEEAPGCGTSSSRFGCWTCTVVEKDRSLQGFIDVGNHHFKALVDFRDWIKEIRNKPEYRQVERRNGRMQFDLLSGKHIPGPFTIQARKMILDKLLQIEKEFGDKLISKDEIDFIEYTWAEELLQKGGNKNG
ncbi:MAG: DNA phosphorothioation system sulfurtransferase DndC [Nitrosomonadales bacterium]|nr:DNA phosphorothioation system sulfurtransferase DndC [Nitrosomonadales bacterium]